MKDLDSESITNAGTTAWFEVNKDGGYVEGPNFSVKEHGIYYYGSAGLS